MKKLLFIEDDKLVGRMYQCGLQLEGFQVDLAENGEVGLAALSFSRPDLVILDLMLPKIDGVQVLNRIRSQPATKTLPIIILSNASGNKLAEEARNAGANVFLTKSETTPPKLLQAVRKQLALPDPTERAFTAPPPAPVATESMRKPSAASDFWETLPGILDDLRTLSHEFLRTDEELHRVLLLSKLRQTIRGLVESEPVSEAQTIRRMAETFTQLLQELENSPALLMPSTIRTISQTVEFLSSLIGRAYHTPASGCASLSEVLVVDDDIITLQAVSHALKRADLKSVTIQDPIAALRLLETRSFGLAIIDVRMPRMDGFELCRQFRLVPEHRHMSVMLLTRHNDFENRLRVAKCGANDFISKPFLFIELAVKALLQVLRSGIDSRTTDVTPFVPIV